MTSTDCPHTERVKSEPFVFYEDKIYVGPHANYYQTGVVNLLVIFQPANGYFLLEEYCLPLGELLAVKVNSRGDSGSHGNSDSAVSSLRRGGFGKGRTSQHV